MKKGLLTLAIALVVLTGFSQTTTNIKSNLILTVGAAIPVGEFAKKDLTNEESGISLIGVNLALDYVYFVTDWLGLGLGAGYRRNGIDEKVIEEFILARGVRDYQITSEGWQTIHISPALILKGKISEQAYFYSKTNFGIAFNKAASYTINSRNSISVAQPSADATAGMLGTALGIRHQGGKLGIGLEVGTIITRSEFDIKLTNNNNQIFRQSMNTVNANITISHAIR